MIPRQATRISHGMLPGPQIVECFAPPASYHSALPTVTTNRATLSGPTIQAAAVYVNPRADPTMPSNGISHPPTAVQSPVCVFPNTLLFIYLMHSGVTLTISIVAPCGAILTERTDSGFPWHSC